MKILEELRKKPWTAEQIRADNTHQGNAYELPAASLGLRVFLGVATVFLALFVIAYGDRMAFPDWRPLPEPWLLWLNTAVLILSSIAMQKGLIAARQARIEGVKTSFLAAGGCAFVFLLGQLLVWQQLVDLGYFVATNPANSFFYLLTALHGVHLLGGLVAWSRIAVRMGRETDAARLRMSVELCTVYWHFLLVVWLVFFALLLFT